LRAVLVGGRAIVTLTFVVGILSAAYMGTFMRLSGDDYCYGAEVNRWGFWRAQIVSYVGQPPYHGDRYSLTFVSGVLSMIGDKASAALPAVSLGLWLGGMTWTMAQLARMIGLRRVVPDALYVAGAVVFLTVYQAPDRVQSVYWRSGNVPYLLPMAVDWILLGLILRQSRAPAASFPSLAGTFLLAFVVAGFSEAGAAMQSAWLSLALVGLLGFRSRIPGESRGVLRGLGAAWAGAGLGIVVMVVSPFTQLGLELHGEHPALLEVLVRSARSSVFFVRETLEGLPTPTVLTFVLGVALGVSGAVETNFSVQRSWRLLLVVGGATALAVLACQAAVVVPSLYAYDALPDQRTMIQARQALVLGWLSLGVVCGLLVGALARSRRWAAAAALGMCVVLQLAFAAYVLRGAGNIRIELPAYRSWATAWDRRDELIQQAIEEGRQDLRVPEIDHIVPMVSELQRDPTYWYNDCAAAFYKVRSITAVLPTSDD
jgi:hypothetical protein